MENDFSDRPKKNNSSFFSKKLRILLLLAAFIIGGIYIFNGYTASKQTEDIVTSKTPNATYLSLKENPLFIEAQAKSKAGMNLDALDLLHAIEPSNNSEYSYLQYEIAQTTYSWDPVVGEEAFFTLMASSTINQPTKAYVVNTLFRHYSSSHDLALLNKIKKRALTWDIPSEVVEKLNAATASIDIQIAILEIGSSYAPLMDTEMRLAYFYTKIAQGEKFKGDMASSETNKNLALGKLAYADTDPNGTVESENIAWMLPLALNRKAMTLEGLAELGVPTEDPEVYFKKALDLSTVEGVFQPFIRYHYATFLMNKYGKERIENIVSLIEPLVANKTSQEMTGFIEFAKNAFKNKEEENISDLNDLSQIYPPFAAVLE